MPDPGDRIYVVDGDEALHALERRPYDSENLLQTLLERYPDLLAGEQMGEGEPRRWVLVAREVGVPGEEGGGNRWSLDHLFLDQDGVPTLVEVKRSTDTRIRREVVGQMLDYAANAVVHWPVDRLVAAFEATAEADGADPVERLAELTDEPDGWDDYWPRVKTNLQAGRVRMVFLADVIPSELRRIVEFLNGQMDPAEVVAVEVRQYVGDGGLRTLVPRVVGQTAQGDTKRAVGRAASAWDRTRFMQALEEASGPEDRSVAERLLQWAEDRGVRIYWGKGSKNGSFTPILDYDGEKHFTFSVWSHSGSVEVMFQHMKAPFDTEDRRRKVLREIKGIPGLALRHENVDARPSFPLDALADPGHLDAFLSVCDRILDETEAR